MKPNKQMRKAIAAGKAHQEATQKKTCAACGGSGYYDAKNNPKCSACKGTRYEDKLCEVLDPELPSGKRWPVNYGLPIVDVVLPGQESSKRRVS